MDTRTDLKVQPDLELLGDDFDDLQELLSVPAPVAEISVELVGCPTDVEGLFTSGQDDLPF